jgi:type IV pilus assembly protein PilN
MPRINLLPWREAERKERKQLFTVALVAAALAAVVATFGVHLLYSAMISDQQARNTLLQAQIDSLNRQIGKINTLRKTERRFIARMQVIERLQRARPQIVHVFDQIVRTVPPGLYLTEVDQKGDRIRFKGVAQSSTRVSEFMRNIDHSQWLADAQLEVIKAGGKVAGSTFTLDAKVTSPKGAGRFKESGPARTIARRAAE